MSGGIIHAVRSGLRAAAVRAGGRLVLAEARAGALRFRVADARAVELRPERARVAVRRVLAEAPCRVDFLDAIVNEVL